MGSAHGGGLGEFGSTREARQCTISKPVSIKLEECVCVCVWVRERERGKTVYYDSKGRVNTKGTGIHVQAYLEFFSYTLQYGP